MEDSIAKVIQLYREQLKTIEDQLAPLLEQRNAKRRIINTLSVDAGAPAPFPEIPAWVTLQDVPEFAASQPDQFTGKPLATIVRDMLQQRKARGLSAISIDELYDHLKAGGFDFPTSNETNAKIGVATTLGKNLLFRRVPNTRLWGLSEWYGGAAKRQKAAPPTGAPSTSLELDDEDVLGNGPPENEFP